VVDKLMSQLGVLVLEYLSFVGLPIYNVLEVLFRSLQLLNSRFKICRQLNAMSDYSKVFQ
jgi:hypothetical protein